MLILNRDLSGTSPKILLKWDPSKMQMPVFSCWIGVLNCSDKICSCLLAAAESLFSEIGTNLLQTLRISEVMQSALVMFKIDIWSNTHVHHDWRKQLAILKEILKNKCLPTKWRTILKNRKICSLPFGYDRNLPKWGFPVRY